MSPEEFEARDRALLRQRSMMMSPFGIAAMSPRGLFFAILLPVAAAIALGIWMHYSSANERAQQQAEDAQFRAYMRECVPKMPAKRCDEIYFWTRGYDR